MAPADIVDDDSPGVQYASGWVLDTSSSASGAENNTRHGTNVSAATAILHFTGQSTFGTCAADHV